MGHPESSTNGWAERHRDALTTHHSHEDVLNDREFERLLEACRDLPAPRGVEALFICLLGGRLGLRAGEIAHFRTGWIDRNRKLIQIPKHEPCDCGYCQRQARQEAAHSDELTPEAALSTHWHPKTVASARQIPFDLSLRIELCVEGFVSRYDEFPSSRTTINRRVKEAAEQAQLTGRGLSALTARDRRQPPRLQRCRPGPTAGVDGLERPRDRSEIHPHLRDCHRRRAPPSPPPVTDFSRFRYITDCYIESM